MTTDITELSGPASKAEAIADGYEAAYVCEYCLEPAETLAPIGEDLVCEECASKKRRIETEAAGSSPRLDFRGEWTLRNGQKAVVVCWNRHRSRFAGYVIGNDGTELVEANWFDDGNQESRVHGEAWDLCVRKRGAE